MKKPVMNYAVEYPVNIDSSYYGDCETNNNSCGTCNTADNSSGNDNGSGNSASVGGGGGWGK